MRTTTTRLRPDLLWPPPRLQPVRATDDALIDEILALVA
ncbi:MAG: hypothetical protein QOE05_1983, partial [Actinomycetota bacterium]|nr:hypothetical protein [Actinomycetota bacterium]